MINFVEFQNSFLINWAKELLEQKVNDFSVPLVFFQSVGGILAFESNLKPNEFEGIDTIKSEFWNKGKCKDLMQILLSIFIKHISDIFTTYNGMAFLQQSMETVHSSLQITVKCAMPCSCLLDAPFENIL